ncbi:hypothetical protein BDV96DRAFT_481710 [Lophiotrema nucula]|uniref:SET domain-containing protein n=1 Tax=Lophiotrema nucula TaxID=690887 RepID=A0A6A5ZVT1_9PLEO|nr:hypothetical protein BDV96DRAFT_481710 [Lophiotrema nucula]
MAAQHQRNTIFLTEQENERIRNTVQESSKRCSEVAGTAREPRERKAAISQATGASLMADMEDRTDKLPAITVGQPYPPCTATLQTLQPMRLAELRLDTHHRGRRLTVQRVSPVVTLAARSWTMIQGDGEAEIERLEICLHKTRHGEDLLESGSTFVIKEPFFTLTEEGEGTLRVDHPSDLCVIYDLRKEAEDLADEEAVAKKLKDQGNASLRQQQLALAHASYSEGLRLILPKDTSQSGVELTRDLHRNRALINLQLDQLDDAKTDAIASLIGAEDERSKQLDSKAYSRAGSAAYNLGEYAEAKRYFSEQDRLTPGDKEARVWLRRIEKRLREQSSGIYEWTAIRAGVSRTRPRVDATSHISNIEVKESEGRGRGLFATRSIPAGDVVMCEKAFCVIWGHEREALTAMTYDMRDDRIRVSPVGLTKAVVEKLLDNPSRIQQVMDLYGDYQGAGTASATKTDEGPVIDAFRVHDIIARNAFGPGSQFGEESARKASTGLWVRAAYINHSCVFNVTKEFVGDMMVLRATRPIAPGEELFHAYDLAPDYDTRQKSLLTTWGFECDCALCVAEKADGPNLRKKRSQLVSEADQMVQKTHWADAKRVAIARAQRLAKAIEDTYTGEYWEGVPRAEAQGIREWLSRASPRR